MEIKSAKIIKENEDLENSVIKISILTINGERVDEIRFSDIVARINSEVDRINQLSKLLNLSKPKINHIAGLIAAIKGV